MSTSVTVSTSFYLNYRPQIQCSLVPQNPSLLADGWQSKDFKAVVDPAFLPVQAASPNGVKLSDIGIAFLYQTGSNASAKATISLKVTPNGYTTPRPEQLPVVRVSMQDANGLVIAEPLRIGLLDLNGLGAGSNWNSSIECDPQIVDLVGKCFIDFVNGYFYK